MKLVAEGFARWIVSYLAVVFVIMFMPVFLITKDVAFFEGVVEYIFGGKR